MKGPLGPHQLPHNGLVLMFVCFYWKSETPKLLFLSCVESYLFLVHEFRWRNSMESSKIQRIPWNPLFNGLVTPDLLRPFYRMAPFCRMGKKSAENFILQNGTDFLNYHSAEWCQLCRNFILQNETLILQNETPTKFAILQNETATQGFILQNGTPLICGKLIWTKPMH